MDNLIASDNDILETVSIVLNDEKEMLEDLIQIFDHDLKIQYGTLAILLRDISNLENTILKHLSCKEEREQNL